MQSIEPEIGVAIFGITGRMGQTLIRALREGGEPHLTLVGAVASAASARLGGDAAADGPATGVNITSEASTALSSASVAIDFSLASAVAANARACVRAGVPLVVGTTGLDADARAALESACAAIPVLIAPNTSVGVNVMARLVDLAARGLGPDYDVEIYDAHHRMKKDAPSGTALALGEVVAGARGRPLADLAVFDRHGVHAPRAPGSIGFAVLRAGDIVGEHTVTFAIAGERVEITHRATDRITFARGALRAAGWLAGRPPAEPLRSPAAGRPGGPAAGRPAVGRPAGLYSMNDVLGFDQP